MISDGNVNCCVGCGVVDCLPLVPIPSFLHLLSSPAISVLPTRGHSSASFISSLTSLPLYLPFLCVCLCLCLCFQLCLFLCFCLCLFLFPFLCPPSPPPSSPLPRPLLVPISSRTVQLLHPRGRSRLVSGAEAARPRLSPACAAAPARAALTNRPGRLDDPFIVCWSRRHTQHNQ